MIKYLLTEDSIYIHDLKITLLNDNPFFEEVCGICKSSSSIEDLMFLKPNLTYENSEISIDNDEAYYNGKYYSLPKEFVSNCIGCFKERTSISKEIIANFLLKLFKNPNHYFEDLFAALEHYGFNFIDNGNILLYKKYASGEEKNKKYSFMNSLLIQYNSKVNKFGDLTGFSIIEADPSQITEDFSIQEYKIRDITPVDFLKNTYTKYPMYSVILKIISTTQKSKIIETLNNTLSVNLQNTINNGKLKFLEELTRDDLNKKFEDLTKIVLRLCQI